MCIWRYIILSSGVCVADISFKYFNFILYSKYPYIGCYKKKKKKKENKCMGFANAM